MGLASAQLFPLQPEGDASITRTSDVLGCYMRKHGVGSVVAQTPDASYRLKPTDYCPDSQLHQVYYNMAAESERSNWRGLTTVEYSACQRGLVKWPRCEYEDGTMYAEGELPFCNPYSDEGKAMLDDPAFWEFVFPSSSGYPMAELHPCDAEKFIKLLTLSNGSHMPLGPSSAFPLFETFLAVLRARGQLGQLEVVTPPTTTTASTTTATPATTTSAELRTTSTAKPTTTAQPAMTRAPETTRSPDLGGRLGVGFLPHPGRSETRPTTTTTASPAAPADTTTTDRLGQLLDEVQGSWDKEWDNDHYQVSLHSQVFSPSNPLSVFFLPFLQKMVILWTSLFVALACLVFCLLMYLRQPECSLARRCRGWERLAAEDLPTDLELRREERRSPELGRENVMMHSPNRIWPANESRRGILPGSAATLPLRRLPPPGLELPSAPPALEQPRLLGTYEVPPPICLPPRT